MKTNSKNALITTALLLAIGSAASARTGHDPPPWDVARMEMQVEDSNPDLTDVRLLAWHIDLVCPSSSPGPHSPPSYSEQALVVAETRRSASGEHGWMLMLVVPYEDGWVEDMCAHCNPRSVFLERRPRVEDLHFIPPIWLEPGLWGDKLVDFGVMAATWRDVFGSEPPQLFRPAEPVEPTCADDPILASPLTEEAACAKLQEGVARLSRLPRPAPAGTGWFCDFADSERQAWFVIALRSNRQCDGPCSNLLGWYAVYRRTGALHEFDVGEQRIGPELYRE